MKKTLTIVVLLAIIVASIVYSVRTSISNKDNQAATTKAVLINNPTTATTPTAGAVSGDVTKGGYVPGQGRYVPGQGGDGCMERSACNYSRSAIVQRNTSCTFAWYTDAASAPAFPAKSDTKVFVADSGAESRTAVEMYIKKRVDTYGSLGELVSSTESDPKLRGKATATNAGRLSGTNACESLTEMEDAGKFFVQKAVAK
ncbi:MAG: hypothetical protein RJB39_33 [Candidatus Parcubacteria bacterium]|jgi:hypothetical protein